MTLSYLLVYNFTLLWNLYICVACTLLCLLVYDLGNFVLRIYMLFCIFSCLVYIYLYIIYVCIFVYWVSLCGTPAWRFLLRYVYYCHIRHKNGVEFYSAQPTGNPWGFCSQKWPSGLVLEISNQSLSFKFHRA